MTICYHLGPRAIRAGLILLPAGAAFAQAPVITAVIPMANASAAARTSSVTVNFSQPLTAASAGALKVFSSQRGGRRTRGTTPAVASGNTLSFAPAGYVFRPGETVRYTVTTAAAGSGGALPRPYVGEFTAAAGPGPGIFQLGSDLTLPLTPPPYPVPHGVALGDVDGDGDLDFVTADDNRDGTVSSTASIGLNNGNGTFSLGARVAVGGRAFSVVLGDIDGDGDLDLLTANNYNPGTVSVRVNNGTGTFTGTQSVAVGAFAHSVALGDVDGDGDLDLVTANNLGSSLTGTASVRLNNGAGIFSGTQDVLLGVGARSVALGDIDGDGDLDFVVANQNAASVSVRVNNGSGTFGGTQTVVVGQSPYGVTLGDIDNDGDLDLVTANITNASFVAGSASVRLNNGAGLFAGSQEVPVSGSSNSVGPTIVTLGDVDGDGDLDLFAASGNRTNTVSIRLNDGSGNYSGTQEALVAPTASPYSVMVGDLDNDGDLDFVTANYDGTGVSVRLNGGTGLATTAHHGGTPALVLFPNPAHATATLAGARPHAPLEILDALGRPVATATADATGTARLVLPAALPAGLYFVRSGTQMSRLVVE